MKRTPVKASIRQAKSMTPFSGLISNPQPVGRLDKFENGVNDLMVLRIEPGVVKRLLDAYAFGMGALAQLDKAGIIEKAGCGGRAIQEIELPVSLPLTIHSSGTLARLFGGFDFGDYWAGLPVDFPYDQLGEEETGINQKTTVLVRDYCEHLELRVHTEAITDEEPVFYASLELNLDTLRDIYAGKKSPSGLTEMPAMVGAR
jgi:hypothetical protein